MEYEIINIVFDCCEFALVMALFVEVGDPFLLVRYMMVGLLQSLAGIDYVVVVRMVDVVQSYVLEEQWLSGVH
jgi:hypothetical protein